MTDWTCIRRDVETEWERNRLRRELSSVLDASGSALMFAARLREENRILRERVRVLTGCAETAERQLEKARSGE